MKPNQIPRYVCVKERHAHFQIFPLCWQKRNPGDIFCTETCLQMEGLRTCSLKMTSKKWMVWIDQKKKALFLAANMLQIDPLLSCLLVTMGGLPRFWRMNGTKRVFLFPHRYSVSLQEHPYGISHSYCRSTSTTPAHLKLKPVLWGRSAEEMHRDKDWNYFLLSSDAWPVIFSRRGESATFLVAVVLPVHWKN